MQSRQHICGKRIGQGTRSLNDLLLHEQKGIGSQNFTLISRYIHVVLKQQSGQLELLLIPSELTVGKIHSDVSYTLNIHAVELNQTCILLRLSFLTVDILKKNHDECTKCAVFSLTPGNPFMTFCCMRQKRARGEIPTLTLTWPASPRSSLNTRTRVHKTGEILGRS